MLKMSDEEMQSLLRDVADRTERWTNGDKACLEAIKQNAQHLSNISQSLTRIEANQRRIISLLLAKRDSMGLSR
jgi:hypothetical protein